MLILPKPYLVFIGDVADALTAKTAFGLRDWVPGDLSGQWRLPGCAITLGLPDLNPAEAAGRGAKALVIGIAPAGGRIPPAWVEYLDRALQAGLDLVSGLHEPLAAIPALAARAQALGRALIDVRRPPPDLPIATGLRRSGKRLLTVGTDCALGKKYTALAVSRAMQAAGLSARFVATGQTGILIAGEGIAIDAVVADFLAGAAELLSPASAPDHWAVIEGQGSLFHPSYAGVSLGLLHGSQPDAVILCHAPGRMHIDGHPGYPVPSPEAAIALTLELGRLTNPDIRCVGVSLNTAELGASERERLLAGTADRLGLPCFDPMLSELGAFAASLTAL